MAEAQGLSILVIGYAGGEITFLNRLVRGLGDAGIKLTVTSSKGVTSSLLKHPNIKRLKTSPWEGNIPARFFRLGVSFFSRFSFQRLGWLKKQVLAAPGLRQKLVILNRYLPFIRGDWDLIYFPWNSAAIGYQGLFELGIPVVLSCRGSQVNIRPHLPGQLDFVAGLRETLQKAAAVHCVSVDIEREAQTYGLEQGKSRIIRPAVDPQFFTPPVEKPENERFRLITTGALVWNKGYEYLLFVLKKLLDFGVDAELHILGQGQMEQAIRFTLFDLNLEQRVYLYGRLKTEEVLAQLQAADAFVLASLSEGISNAVLEAMSCGLPVVTTDCGGMSEAVTDGVEGFLVPLRDPHSMAQGLLKLSKDYDLRMSMGKAARERICGDFKLEDQAKAFVELFKFAVKTNEE